MKKLAVLLLALSTTVFAEEEVSISKLDTMVTQRTGEYTYFSYKVGITNRRTNPIAVNLMFDGFDRNGFLLEQVRIKGEVGKNIYKQLSDKTLVKSDIYNKIVKWEIHE